MSDFYGSVVGSFYAVCKPLSKYRAYRILVYLLAFLVGVPLALIILLVVDLLRAMFEAAADACGAAAQEYALIPRIWKAERNWNKKEPK